MQHENRHPKPDHIHNYPKQINWFRWIQIDLYNCSFNKLLYSLAFSKVLSNLIFEIRLTSLACRCPFCQVQTLKLLRHNKLSKSAALNAFANYFLRKFWRKFIFCSIFPLPFVVFLLFLVWRQNRSSSSSGWSLSIDGGGRGQRSRQKRFSRKARRPRSKLDSELRCEESLAKPNSDQLRGSQYCAVIRVTRR